MRAVFLLVTAVLILARGPAVQTQPAIGDLVDRASRYVVGYDSSSSILALDEESVQWLERPVNPGTNLSRTNLGMMLVHPQVRERFSFTHDGGESLAGRYVERVSYRETARPTLIKTTRGKDRALTETIAADPIVRAQVTVTFRRDGELGLWVPERMEEYDKANLALDDIFSNSSFTTPRGLQAGGR